MRLIYNTSMDFSFGGAVDSIHPFWMQIDDNANRLIVTARLELAQKVAALSDGQSATWGFFPELAPDFADYPACVALYEWFDAHFLTLPNLKPFSLRLAFIRLATSEPQSSFGGLHVDASAGIDHLPPKDLPRRSDAILRILINLYDQPRELQYSPESIGALRAKGANIPSDHYKIVEVVQDAKLKSYLVPPKEAHTVHGIMFNSRSVLHAGRTNKKGHFLISYGAYTTSAAIKQLFA